MPSPTRVLMLRDEAWLPVPGACCWRHSLPAAFAAAGATVDETTYRPVPVAVPAQRTPSEDSPGEPAPGESASGKPASGVPASGEPVSRGRAAWLPAAARRPLVAAYRGQRAMLGGGARLARRLAAAHRRRSAALLLADAELVIAESPTAASHAAQAGVPPRRLWALAQPSGRLFAGESAGYAAELNQAAPLVGGFLVGSEPARESVERATSSWPTRVQLFPQAAADRPCPICGQAPSGTAEVQVRAAEALLAAAVPQAPRRPRPRRSVLLAGYDLKFAAELAEHLDRRTDLNLTVDDWPDLGKPTAQTQSRLRSADAVFAEWARTSAVWLSQRKRPGQFLAVRLHRFELDSRYPREIVLDNVDAVVYIAPLFGRRIREELGWPAEKLVYIPNFLDVDWLDRPKLPEARFTIGFVGMEWSRKRFDLALDLIAALRREDLRFTLAVRSAMPWHNPYAWTDPAEREYAGRCFARIEEDPLLRTGVFFDPPGRDMARWYRKVGHLASTSDAEGSHASLAEAMASGAVPVVRAWPGAAELYGKEWIHTATEEAVASVLESLDADLWQERAARARAEVRRTHDPAGVVEAWADLLHGDLTAARRPFAEYAPVMGEA